MYFESLSDILTMQGHGKYVWSAYAITAVLLAYLVISPMLRSKQTLQKIKRRVKNSATAK